MSNHPTYNILHLLETPGIGVVKTNTILSGLDADFAQKDLRPLLSAKQYEEFIATEEKAREDWEKLAEMNVATVSILDEQYPEVLRNRLQKNAPPLLMVLGNLGLLRKLSASFCGSRKASEKGLATATDCADQLAREGINIVSGYAAGVDMATHRAALACGGTTTLVLCEGILHFTIKRHLKELWNWEKVAVVSEFLPSIPWNVKNAMQRNKTICALSSSMILIESSSRGGSIEAGRSCLKMGVPLFAPVYEGMPETALGNRELLRQGAKELYKNNATNRANMTNVFRTILHPAETFRQKTPTNKTYQIDKSDAQLSLFERGAKFKEGQK